MTARDTEELSPASTAARPTGLRDVAKLAGVSVASASMALNGQPGVSDETRRRIAAAAERLGYRANPQAQALRSGRSSMYGFVVRNLANPFFLDVMSGAEQIASEAGATLLVLDSQYSIDREAEHIRNMAAQRLAGLAIAPVGAGNSISMWQQLRPGTQLEVGITTLFVTHDQEEALAIADRVGVMRAGRLEQLASPTEVYSRPATSFVAEFVGLSNRLAGTVTGSVVTVRGHDLPLVDLSTPAGPVTAIVRPEAVTLASDESAADSPISGTVIASTFLGATSRVTVDLGDTTVMAQLPTSEATTLSAGSRVTLTIRPDPVLVSAESAVASEE